MIRLLRATTAFGCVIALFACAEQHTTSDAKQLPGDAGKAAARVGTTVPAAGDTSRRHASASGMDAGSPVRPHVLDDAAAPKDTAPPHVANHDAETTGDDDTEHGATDDDEQPDDAADDEAVDAGDDPSADVIDETCDTGGSGAQMYTVPPGGGRFEFCTLHGEIVRFDFPASAGGLEVIATAIDVQTHDWPNPGFSDAIRDAIDLQPQAALFDTPVKVRLPRAAPIAFLFGSSSTVPIPLARSGSPIYTTTLDLERFGLLGVVDLERSCEEQDGTTYGNGFSEELDPGYCSGFGPKSKVRSFGCTRQPFCYLIGLVCCVYPDDTRSTCSTEDSTLFHTYTRANPVDGHAYCDDLGPTPYVKSVEPASLTANYLDQTITLTGNNFQPGGYVFGGPLGSTESSFVVQSTWVSSTTATAVISGLTLDPIGGAVNVGYKNPSVSGNESDWRRSSNFFIVPLDTPDTICPVLFQGDPPAGACSSNASGCECGVSLDTGSGTHDYGLSCSGDQCECTRDGVPIVSKSTYVPTVCDYPGYTQKTWRELCLHTPGFCP